MSSVETFFKEAKELHLKTITGFESAVPVVFMLKNNKMMICPIMGCQDRSPMDALKPIVEATSPTAYIFCAESWMKMYDQKDPKQKAKAERDRKKLKYGDISKMKDKKEVMIRIGSSMDNKVKISEICDIIRDKQNKIIDLVIREDLSNKDEFESTKLP